MVHVSLAKFLWPQRAFRKALRIEVRLFFRDYYADLTVHSSSPQNFSPRVSVILPTYARGHGPLQRAIESVLAQTYSDFEFLIVDDGSRDNTWDVLSDYLRLDQRLTVLRFHGNSGLPALRVNQAILAARGDFVAYQFDDDIWTTDSLEARMGAALTLGLEAVVYGNTDVELLQPDGRVTTGQLGGPYNYGRLSNGNYIANNAVLHHRAILNRVGLYDPHVLARRFSDYDLWLRIGRQYELQHVDTTVSRVYANQDNSLARTIQINHSEYRRYLEINRNRRLHPDAIEDYEVNGTELLTCFSQQEIDKIKRSQIIPFVARHNDYTSSEELHTCGLSRRSRRRIVVTKPDYSTSIDVTIRNFADLPDCQFSQLFVVERELSAIEPQSYDAAILYRTLAPQTTQFANANKEGATFIYLMDDNMLHFNEVGPEHAYLAPGQPAYIEVARQISTSHACVGYSDPIMEDIRALNPHALRLDTNMPERYLHRDPSAATGKVRIAILTGPVRADIVRQLIWPALDALMAAHPDEFEVHIWGLPQEQFPALPGNVFWRAFSHSYDLYRNRLREAQFDLVLVPLDASTRAAQSKSPIKLLEALACGAVCICSDVPPYSELPDDVCVKVKNDSQSWQTAILRVLQIGATGRASLFDRARRLAMAKYATEVQAADFLTALDAADLHRHLGRRKILFVFHEALLGGATLHLLHHAALAASLGFDVVGLVREGAQMAAFKRRWAEASHGAELFAATWSSGYIYANGCYGQRAISSDDNEEAIRLSLLLEAQDFGCVHAATWMPAICRLARIREIPSIFSLHQFYPLQGDISGEVDAVHCSSLMHGGAWSAAIGAPTRRIVCPVEKTFFECFEQNIARPWSSDFPRRVIVSGTLQARKNQLDAIKALALLADKEVSMDLIGYDNLDLAYARKCRDAIIELGLEQRVKIHGFVDKPADFYMDGTDILLVSSTDESMPQTLLQAMAAGVIVVSTAVGGVSELIRHRYTGFIASEPSPASIATSLTEALNLSAERRQDILRRAHKTISFLGRPSYVRSELIDLYNQAFEKATARQPSKPPRALSHAIPAAAGNQILPVERLLDEAESLEKISLDIVPAIAGDYRVVSHSCHEWETTETASRINCFAVYISCSSAPVDITITIASEKRLGRALRTTTFRLEIPGTHLVLGHFIPLQALFPQRFKLRIQAVSTPISVALAKGQATVLFTGEMSTAKNASV